MPSSRSNKLKIKCKIPKIYIKISTSNRFQKKIINYTIINKIIKKNNLVAALSIDEYFQSDDYQLNSYFIRVAKFIRPLYNLKVLTLYYDIILESIMNDIHGYDILNRVLDDYLKLTKFNINGIIDIQVPLSLENDDTIDSIEANEGFIDVSEDKIDIVIQNMKKISPSKINLAMESSVRNEGFEKLIWRMSQLLSINKLNLQYFVVPNDCLPPCLLTMLTLKNLKEANFQMNLDFMLGTYSKESYHLFEDLIFEKLTFEFINFRSGIDTTYQVKFIDGFINNCSKQNKLEELKIDFLEVYRPLDDFFICVRNPLKKTLFKSLKKFEFYDFYRDEEVKLDPTRINLFDVLQQKILDITRLSSLTIANFYIGRYNPDKTKLFKCLKECTLLTNLKLDFLCDENVDALLIDLNQSLKSLDLLKDVNIVHLNSDAIFVQANHFIVMFLILQGKQYLESLYLKLNIESSIMIHEYVKDNHSIRDLTIDLGILFPCDFDVKLKKLMYKVKAQYFSIKKVHLLFQGLKEEYYQIFAKKIRLFDEFVLTQYYQ